MTATAAERPAKKPARIMVSVRVAPAGDTAMREIAKVKGIDISEARRQAFAEYVQRNKRLIA